MVKVQATFRIVTPMFISGLDQQASELRGASFKGGLRFWWRALAYDRLAGDLAKIRQEEARLFGSSDQGQGTFLLRIGEISGGKELTTWELFRGRDGLKYLGYGLDNRKAMNSGTKFTVELCFRGEQVDETVLQAIKVFGLLGGLGGRTRRGFGSLTLEKLEGGVNWSRPENLEKYIVEVQNLLGDFSLELPEYTAFSSRTRIEVAEVGTDPLGLHNALGRSMHLFRSATGEKNFPGDARIAAAASEGRNFGAHPDRVAFGLPHNYFFPQKRASVNCNSEGFERRASPLFLHIHALGDGNYAAIVTLLPAEFLPSGDRITLASRGNKTFKVNQNVDLTVLENFLDGADKKPRFPDKKSIYPRM